MLPKDVKIVPYYDRSDLIEETTSTVEANLIRGMMLVLIVLGIFLFNIRAAIIVAITIPFALMFSFICLDWRHIPANLLSIGAIDFGILVDGAVVMVENVFRELAARHGEEYDLIYVIRAAAKDVERPIFYAVAVIIAGYLPIYVLTGPSGKLFQPMADTMGFALVGSVVCALILLPVLCSYLLRGKINEPRVSFFDFIRRGYGVLLGWCLRNRTLSTAMLLSIFAASLLLIPLIGAEFMPHLDEGALWMRATAPYTISFEEASKLSPQIRDILRTFPQVTTVANELGRPDDGTDSTGFFNNEYYIGLKPYSRQRVERQGSQQEATGGRDQRKDVGVSGRDFQLHAARRGCGGRSRNRIEELAGREDLRRRSGDAGGKCAEGEAHHFQGSRHRRYHRRARTRSAEPDCHARTARRSPNTG